MGTTFVTLGRDRDGRPTDVDNDQVGFWMRDSSLELWLRLLALHVADPDQTNRRAAVIRDQWLLASRGIFPGCVPHGLNDATADPSGLSIVKNAVAALSTAVRWSSSPISPDTLGLIGLDGWQVEVSRDRLLSIADAFQNLLEFRISTTASDSIPLA